MAHVAQVAQVEAGTLSRQHWAAIRSAATDDVGHDVYVFFGADHLAAPSCQSLQPGSMGKECASKVTLLIGSMHAATGSEVIDVAAITTSISNGDKTCSWNASVWHDVSVYDACGLDYDEHSTDCLVEGSDQTTTQRLINAGVFEASVTKGHAIVKLAPRCRCETLC